MESPEQDPLPAAGAAKNGEPPTSASRSRFNRYREQVRQRELPTSGSFHGPVDSRPARPRVRTARQLVWEFLRLLIPFRRQVFWILASATAATLVGLLPPAGTKFIIDYGLTGKSLPQPWLDRFPQLADPHRLLLVTVVAVTVVSMVKIVIYLWGRWYATKISKQIQLGVRHRVFEHAVRLPLHRVQQIRSGGVASILREDGGAVGELMFGMLFNPWRARRCACWRSLVDPAPRSRRLSAR